VIVIATTIVMLRLNQEARQAEVVPAAASLQLPLYLAVCCLNRCNE
jgi:hypothetical protein